MAFRKTFEQLKESNFPLAASCFMCLHSKFYSKIILAFIISFSHYTLLASLDAFVNAVEIPSQNNMIMKKNDKKLERKLLVQTLSKFMSQ